MFKARQWFSICRKSLCKHMLDSWTMRTKESQKWSCQNLLNRDSWHIESVNYSRKDCIFVENIVRPSVNRRSDDTAFGAGTFSWQDPVHSWKACPGEVMTVENLFIYLFYQISSFFPTVNTVNNYSPLYALYRQMLCVFLYPLCV